MFMPAGFRKRMVSALAVSLLVAITGLSESPLSTKVFAAESPDKKTKTLQHRLEAGEVLVNSEDIQGTKYVVARILIDESPEKLWPVLVNPFEFQGRICHRMKRVDILTDEPDTCVMGCKVGVAFPIPDFDYVVESKYIACKRIDFHRIRGSFRDFKGFWALQPHSQGSKTEVTYSMYLDPGFPVPDWMVRQGVRSELPQVLVGLRDRINELKHNLNASPEKHNIAASSGPGNSL